MTFWFNDPFVLFNKNKIFDIWPSNSQDLDDKLNSVTRLIILLTLFGTAITRNLKIVITSLITLVILVIIYKSKKINSIKKLLNTKESFITKQNSDDTTDKPELTKPTVKNPLMNVLLPEIKYNPKRPAAEPSFDPTVEKNITNKTSDIGIDPKLFLDLGDNINFEREFSLDQSMQRFYTTANSKVGNDQNAFAEFCYGKMPSCKEGDSIQCLKNANNSSRWINY
tara:strand:- start:1611 stop:2285 length:675 start_codon:yes stop_codon:yes gene_type:complete